jgi:phage-related protein
MSTGAGEPERKPIVFLGDRIKTPPFSTAGRFEAGESLARLQDGESLGPPLSKPMKSIGPRCHELRFRDEEHSWRIFYRIDPDAILVIDVMAKKTPKTPKAEIVLCRKRLAAYDRGEGPIREGKRRG